jgi:hypothetical protein
MISDEIRQSVEGEFPDDPELRNDVLRALSLDKNLMRLTDDPKRKQWEAMALKRIQEAEEKGVIPDQV